MTDQPHERDVVRAARLDSLSVLLTRIANGLTLTPEEARLLVKHVSVEVSESTTARAAGADLTRRDDQAEPAEPVHGCTINGQPAMPILISEYNQLVADLAQAQAAADRVRALAGRWTKAGPPPLGTPIARWVDRRLVELNTALNPSEDSAP